MFMCKGQNYLKIINSSIFRVRLSLSFSLPDKNVSFFIFSLFSTTVAENGSYLLACLVARKEKMTVYTKK